MKALLHRVAASMRRLASWRLVIVAGLVFAAFAVFMFGSTAPFSIGHVRALCGQAPPDVRFFTSAADLRGFMTGCGEVGRSAYRNLQLADLLYPTVSAVFMASALATMLSRTTRDGSAWLAAASLPLMGAGFDYLENVAAWITLLGYPEQSGSAATLLGAASAVKQTVSWLGGLLLMIVLGCALALWAMRQWRERVSTSAR